MIAEATVLDRVFELLAQSPTPEEILSIHTTKEEDERLRELATLNEKNQLSWHESLEIQQYLLAEKYIRFAKAHAFAKLNNFEL